MTSSDIWDSAPPYVRQELKLQSSQPWPDDVSLDWEARVRARSDAVQWLYNTGGCAVCGAEHMLPTVGAVPVCHACRMGRVVMTSQMSCRASQLHHQGLLPLWVQHWKGGKPLEAAYVITELLAVLPELKRHVSK